MEMVVASVWCLILNCLHTFLSAMIVSQYLCRCFWRARLVCRVMMAVLPVGDTDDNVARVARLGLSGCGKFFTYSLCVRGFDPCFLCCVGGSWLLEWAILDLVPRSMTWR
jgi:hypothetical protein